MAWRQLDCSPAGVLSPRPPTAFSWAVGCLARSPNSYQGHDEPDYCIAPQSSEVGGCSSPTLERGTLI